MNYFDNVNFSNNVITVLGADKDSNFVKALVDFLGKDGSVTVTDKLPSVADGYTVVVPDKDTDGKFILHNESDIEAYKNAGMLIGLVSVRIIEKKISDISSDGEALGAIMGLKTDELVFPMLIARAIEKNEKYDWLYIYNVFTESERFIARETAKSIKADMGIKLINANQEYTETLTLHS